MGSLSDWPIQVPAVEARVARPEHGAVLSFVGVARASSVNAGETREVVALEFEAYAPMVLQELAKIEAEARTRWPAAAFEVVHRVGRLSIGEPAVVVVVAAPHRAEAYDCNRFLIEELKARLPIFKREIYADGASWVGNRA